MNRAEHLSWCKQRAMEYVNRGDLQEALASMLSDLGKHSETEGSAASMGPISLAMMMGGMLNTREEMRRFIQGFN